MSNTNLLIMYIVQLMESNARVFSKEEQVYALEAIKDMVLKGEIKNKEN